MQPAAFLVERVTLLVPLLLSLSVHEWAHAWAANRLGDDTARLGGRMTVDPIAHIDPVGTLLLPLFGVPVGWAVPVPVNPTRFRLSMPTAVGLVLVAGAGPASNVALACVAAAVWHAVPVDAVQAFATTVVRLNLALAWFNLLPVPPLDGSRIVDWLLPDSLRPAWSRLQAAGPVGVAVLVGALTFAGLPLFYVPNLVAKLLL